MLVEATRKAKSEPSWGRVLATTIRLWVPRRLAAWRWRLVSLSVAVALGTVASLLFTGVLTGTTSLAAPTSPVVTKGPAVSKGTGPAPAPTSSATQTEAAAWIASQVSTNMIVACYPVMCTALQAHGVLAGRLMPLRPGPTNSGATSSGAPNSGTTSMSGAPSMSGADVVVTSSPASARLAQHYAPALIASFGSGQDQVEVRAAEPGGPGAYAAALRADLAARRSAGSQLAGNARITFNSREDTELRTGEVDSRLLTILAALAAQFPIRVVSFSGTSPGAAVLFRGVTLTVGTSKDSKNAPALAMVQAQSVPYLPARAAIAHQAAGPAGPAAGPTALNIEFAAPSPLGLLGPVS